MCRFTKLLRANVRPQISHLAERKEGEDLFDDSHFKSYACVISSNRIWVEGYKHSDYVLFFKSKASTIFICYFQISITAGKFEA